MTVGSETSTVPSNASIQCQTGGAVQKADITEPHAFVLHQLAIAPDTRLKMTTLCGFGTAPAVLQL